MLNSLQRWLAGWPTISPALAVSTAALIASNLVPLYAAVALGWPVAAIVILFWLENLIVGILNLLRIVTASSQTVPPRAKLTTAIFFSFHYGIFWVVHGAFVFALFIRKSDGDRHMGLEEIAANLWSDITQGWFFAALAGIALSHLVSYFVNYLGQGEFRRLTADQLMMLPYRRVIVLHLTIIGTGFAAQLFGANLAALLLLVGVKMVVDLQAHLREHAYFIPSVMGIDGPEMSGRDDTDKVRPA